MSKLPQSWAGSTLAEVAQDISYGFTTSAASTVDNPKLLRITDVQDYSVAWKDVPYCKDAPPDEKLLSSGDIVIARTGATTGKSYLIDEVPTPTAFASYLIRVRSSEAVEPEYLWKFMWSPDYWRQITVVSKGTAQPGANASILGGLELPIPPLPEQRRIVAKLDRLSARAAAARDHLARTTKLATRAKQAILTEAFRGGVSSKEHREYADRQEIDTPFAIPATWEWKTAEELCEWITKGTTPKRNDLNSDGGDVPFIKVYNLTFDGSLDFTKEPTFVSKSIHEGFLKRSKVFPGDILMNIVGPPLGKVSVVPETHPEWNMNQAIAVFRAKDEVLPAFLAKWLLSEAYLSWATALSKATAGQKNLTLEICRRSPVPVPPLDEQAEIVRRIEAAFSRIDRLTEEASRAAHLLDRLDERLLAKAFRGELVPQNPDDEPAEALLTRIREARAANPKAKRGRRKAMV